MNSLYGFFRERLPAFWHRKTEALFSLASTQAALLALSLFILDNEKLKQKVEKQAA